MDHVTERIIQQVIMDESENYTIIRVSHRLEMTMDFYMVQVMEREQVVQRGNPRVLAMHEICRFGPLWIAGENGTLD